VRAELAQQPTDDRNPGCVGRRKPTEAQPEGGQAEERPKGLRCEVVLSHPVREEIDQRRDVRDPDAVGTPLHEQPHSKKHEHLGTELKPRGVRRRIGTGHSTQQCPDSEEPREVVVDVDLGVKTTRRIE